MPGVDRFTGKPLAGWPHVVQSVGVIITTLLATRPMRRDFGCEVMALLDRAISNQTLGIAYGRIASALRRWEPRFRLERVTAIVDGPNGVVEFVMTGVFVPDGISRTFSVGPYSLSGPVP